MRICTISPGWLPANKRFGAGVASKIGGIPTAIDNLKNGILVEQGNPKNLGEMILEVIANDELAQNLGMNARIVVMARSSVERMVKDTIGVYEGVCKL